MFPFIIIAAISLLLGAQSLTWFKLAPTTGSCAALVLVILCVQSMFGLIVGSFDLLAAGIGFCILLMVLLPLVFWGHIKIRAPIDLMPQDAISIASVVFVTVALSVAFINALAPVTSWDAGVAHLALAADYARARHIALIPGNNYSAYPQLMHVLYALSFLTRVQDHPDYQSAEHSAVSTAWLFGVLACGVAYGLGTRLHSRTTGAIAAAVLATSPIFLDQASSPSLDLAYTATVLGALYALASWRDERRVVWLVIAGVLAGSGCGIRHTAFLVSVLLVIGVLILARESRIRSVAYFVTALVASAAPWLIHTALVVGNPIYPFFASRFANAAIPDVDVAAIGTHSSLQGQSIAQLLVFPWSFTMNSAHYGGWSTSPGALWLVLGVVGVIAGGWGARLIAVFSGAGLTAIFFFQRFARYAFPFIAPMMVVAALPFEKTPKLRLAIFPALIVSYLIGLAPAIANATLRLPVVTARESREAYLADHIERYPAMAWAAQNISPGATILSVDPRGYYLMHPAYTNFEGLKSIAPLRIEAQRDWLRAHEIPYVFYADAYVRDSPAFRENGVLDMLNAWRADTEHFHLIKSFDLQSPRTGGAERVEIYEFRPE